MLMRATQSLFDPSQCALQCYVDDPFLAARGPPEARLRSFSVAVLFWLALGCRLAWVKGLRGRQVQWIGAEVFVGEDHGSVVVTIPPEKRKALARELRAVRAHGRKVPGRYVRPLAGKVEWIAGLLP